MEEIRRNDGTVLSIVGCSNGDAYFLTSGRMVETIKGVVLKTYV